MNNRQNHTTDIQPKLTVRKSITSKKNTSIQENSRLKSIPKSIRGKIPGKRLTDLIIGFGAFFVFLVLYPFIALGIRLCSPGNVIYKQKRTGLDGYVFTCYKFRTMHTVEKLKNKHLPIVTEKGDSRIFNFGSILRKTNLDELPQVINVLKGEMSLVGPRPYPIDECNHWNNTFDDFYYRYMIKPGITGYAQVSGYRGGTLDKMHMRKRLDKDLIYIEKQSLKLDSKILFQTVHQMLSFKTNAH